MNLLSKKILLEDSNNWNFTTLSGTWNSVALAERLAIPTYDHLYMAVGNDGLYTTSEDGINWTAPSQLVEGNTSQLKCIAVAPKMVTLFSYPNYIVVGNEILAAGINLPDADYVSVITGANWNAAVVTSNTIVAVGQSSGYLATTNRTNSTPNWTISNNKFGTLLSPQCIVYTGSVYVVAGEDGEVSTSTNGTTWTTPTQIASYINWQDIIYAEGKIILLGSRLAGSHMSYISTSTDGTTWTTPVYIGDGRRSIAYGNGEYIAVGDNGGLSISENLTSWQRTTTDITTNWKSIIAGNDRFVMVGVGYVAYKEF